MEFDLYDGDGDNVLISATHVFYSILVIVLPESSRDSKHALPESFIAPSRPISQIIPDMGGVPIRLC